MKVFWKEPKLLQIEAESAADLNMVRDLLHPGSSPLASCEWLRCPTEAVTFRSDGCSW